MFNGLTSTQTPTVQWWDYSKSASSGTTTISLADDCASVQYFATGGSTTAIKVTLPVSPAQGKTITIKNEVFGSNNQKIQIIYGTFSNPGTAGYLAILGAGGTITLCYIGQNTLANTNNYSSPWVPIAGGQVLTNRNISTAFGYDGTASGRYSTVGGGYVNSVTAEAGTVSGGYGNSVSGLYSTVGGGQSNTASGSSLATVCGGTGNTANSLASTVVGGTYGISRGIIGYTVFPACQYPLGFTTGAAQGGYVILAGQTTTATSKLLTSDGSTAGSTNQLVLPNNSAYYFRGSIIAGVTGAGNTKNWTFDGVIKRGASAGTVVFVGTPTIVSTYADVGAAAWTAVLTTDTTRGALAVTVTGEAATTIQWVCKIETTEMTY